MASMKNKSLTKTTMAIVAIVIVVIAAIGGWFFYKKRIAPAGPSGPVTGPAGGTGGVQAPGAKNILVVAYSGATKLPDKDLVPYSSISPSWYSNISLDALIWAGRKCTDPEARKVIYNVIQKITNDELPLIWLVQTQAPRVYWEWMKNVYFHPTLRFRFNYLGKDPSAPEPDVIRYGGTEEPHSLDPAVSYWGFDWWIMYQIYDRLVTYEGENTEYVVPSIAVAWAHTTDATEWYFVIRDGVKFYDPWDNKTYPLTPEDVVYSLRRVVIMHQDPYWLIDTFIDINASDVVSLDDFKSLLSQGLLTEFKGSSKKVTSLDELLKFFGYSGSVAGVVKLKLKMPYPAILNVLATMPASIVCKEVVEAHGGVKPGEENTWMYEHPVGSGPYYMVKWAHRQYVELAANPYYWGDDKPKVKHVKIFLIPEDETRIMQFTKGDLDMIDMPASLLFKVEGATLNYGGKTWKVVVRKQNTLTIMYAVPNCNKEPFNKKEVRQALAYAIPYDQIAKVAYGGLAFKAYGVIPKGMFGFQNDGVINYTYNLDKAKELLKRAGVDPSKYTITILICEGYKELQDEATILQMAWSQLGFTVKIEVASRPTFNERIMSKTGFDVNLIGWGPDYVDPDDYASPLACSGYQFKDIKIVKVSSLDEAKNIVNMTSAKQFTYGDWLVIVGEAK